MARHHSTGRSGGNGAAGSSLAESKAALVAIAAEADELRQAVGAPITDAVAGWLAPRYALAVREQLAPLEGEGRLKLLRAFVQDWALLRHGDQTAERLRIERGWLEIASRNADSRFKRKIIMGLETLKAYVDEHPEAKSAMDELCRQVRHPFDPTESDQIRP